MSIKCLLQAIAMLCLAEKFFLVSLHFSFKFWSQFNPNSVLIMWTFSWFTLIPKTFTCIFLGDTVFFSKKVFFVFYWIVNLASLFLICFYTILLQTFISFEIAKICFLLIDATWDYYIARSRLQTTLPYKNCQITT